MPKKQKKKRKKEYIPKTSHTYNQLKPEKQTEFTTKNAEKQDFILNYVKWCNGNYTTQNKSKTDCFKKWYGMAYKKGSQKDKDGDLFTEWFNYQKSKNLKVYAFDKDKFVQNKIKKTFKIPIKDDMVNLFVEISAKEKKTKTSSHPNTTYFDRDTRNQMIVFNSLNQAFTLETQIIEKEKIVIKKEQITQKVNADKTEKFKKKIKGLVKSKQFEKSYLNSFDNVKKEILNVIN